MTSVGSRLEDGHGGAHDHGSGARGGAHDYGAADVGFTAPLIEFSPRILCMVDLEGTIVWCNASMTRVLRYDEGELIGVSIATLVHPDDRGVIRRNRETLDAGTEVSGIVVRTRCKDRTWRSLEWTARADRGRGVVYGAGGDVTEQRKTEEALRNDEARLRAILDSAPSSIFAKDLQGRYLIVNQQWSRITGVPAQDAVGVTADECWQPEAASIAEHESVLLASGSPQVSDERMHTRAGVRDFRVSRFLMVDGDGAPYAMGGVATDITTRTAAERELVSRERLLASVLRASPDVITLLDRQGAVQRVSDAHLAILGLRHGDDGSRDLMAVVHPDDAERVTGAYADMVSGAVANVQVRFRVQHADGHWLTLDSRGQAVRDEAGNFAGAVVVSRDMTARIVSEQRLRGAREAAERASRAKSEFLSRMSHELRTPLNSILGFAQLLQMDELPDEQCDAIAHILRAGRHLLDLIDEVLDIARIESGHLELMMASVSVADIVNDAVELTRPMAQAAEVSVRVAIDPGSAVRVRADRQRLLQVLLNLLSNAVKYNHPDGHVDVACHQSAPGRVRLVVADSGRGIRPEDVDRVFTPFDRLGAEQSGIQGTGVGLALSQQLVQRMGGRIGFESNPDVGSLFFVELSIATGAAEVRPESGPALGWPERVSAMTGGRPFRVLLMEDDAASLDLVERVLARRPGIELLATMHGSLGVELAREHRPDLILVDLHLSDMPGMVVLDRLGADEATSVIPVAVVGSDAAAHEVRQLLGRGVVGFLAKPFDVRALLSLVDAVRTARVA
ncbi:MAG TPA: PAS domain S-box protein [Acidimicrobiales bacterium]|nr:PAS domain S-box protein [Acidimicrobiales bacterium]